MSDKLKEFAKMKKEDVQSKLKEILATETVIEDDKAVIKITDDSFEKSLNELTGFDTDTLKGIHKFESIYKKEAIHTLGDELVKVYKDNSKVSCFEATAPLVSDSSIQVKGNRVNEGEVNGKPYRSAGFTAKVVGSVGVGLDPIKKKLNEVI